MKKFNFMCLAHLCNRPAGRHGVTSSCKTLFGNNNIPKSRLIRSLLDFKKNYKSFSYVILLIFSFIAQGVSSAEGFEICNSNGSSFEICNSNDPSPCVIESDDCSSYKYSFMPANSSLPSPCNTACTTVTISCNGNNFKDIYPETGETTVSIGCLITRGCLLSTGSAASTPQYIRLNCALIVDQDYTFYNSQIIMDGTSNPNENYIEVGGYKLSAVGSTFRGCDESWTGFKMASGGHLNLRNNCNIYDARFGIQLASSSRVTSYLTTFKRCSIAIYGSGVSAFTHSLLGNKFYGDEDLNTPLTSKPLRGINLINCGFTFSSNNSEFHDFTNTSINAYPIYVDRTDFTANNLKCDGYKNDGVFAIDATKTHNLYITGSGVTTNLTFSNFNGTYNGKNGNGINCSGYNLTANYVNIDGSHKRGIKFIPTTTNQVKIKGGKMTGVDVTAINLNPSPFKLYDYYGEISDVTIKDCYNGIVVNGRKGPLSDAPTYRLLIKDNSIDTSHLYSIQNNECNYTSVVSNEMTGVEDYEAYGIYNNRCQFIYTADNDPVEFFKESGIGNDNSLYCIYSCNHPVDNDYNEANGFHIANDATGLTLEKNTIEDNYIGINATSARNMPSQRNKSNKWISNDDNIAGGGGIIFVVASIHDGTEYDPGEHVTFAGNDQAFTCPDYGEIDPTKFKTDILNSVVNDTKSYDSGHEGDEYQDKWNAYSLLKQYPEILTGYSAAQSFYDSIDTTDLASYYLVFDGLNTLHAAASEQSEDLKVLIDSINEQVELLIQAQDSIDVEVENAKNDSLTNVIDSLSDVIIDLKRPADSLRTIIEDSATAKLSYITDILDELDPSDSIEIKLKQVLELLIERAENDTLTTEQLNTLEWLSGQCFYEFGPAIDLARNFYPVEENYDDENCAESLILSNGNFNKNFELVLYPNPVNGAFILLNKMKLNFDLNIVNLQGVSIYNTRINKDQDYQKVETANWPDGTYFLTCKTESNIYSKIIVVSN